MVRTKVGRLTLFIAFFNFKYLQLAIIIVKSWLRMVGMRFLKTKFNIINRKSLIKLRTCTKF